MYAQISGNIIKLRAESVIIITNGIGFEIHLPQKHLEKLQTEDTCTVWTYLHVTENSHTLFGFEKFEEREMFENLISVSGIGPKIGLNILSHASLESIHHAVQSADISLFTAVPGIGKKNASRLILELQTKLDMEKNDVAQVITSSEESETIFKTLEGLGFTQREIQLELRNIDQSISTEEKIKQLLKKM